MSVTIRRHGLHASTGSVEQRPVARRARRVGVAAFFISVAVNAALGIYAVLAQGFGETQGKILGTSLCVTGAVLIGLACVPAWERRLLGPVPPLAAALGAIGFVIAIAGIWTAPSSETWAKVMMTIFTFSIAGVIASLLALARVAPRHGWLVRVTFVLLALSATMYSTIPWLGDEPGETFVRTLGVVMIALAAFAVTVPVVHWLDRSTLAALEAETGTVHFCPYCGHELTGEIAEHLACSRCGRGFEVTAAPGHGPQTST
jgi:hypothetical protein